MAFIQKYARVDGSGDNGMSTDDDEVVRNDFGNNFIDDSVENNQDQDLTT